MNISNRVLLITMLFLVGFLWITIKVSFSQQEFSSRMNASISQPICISLSQSYSTGIFFTNTTTIGTQYAITNMGVLNNATDNYRGTNFATMYNVTACAGNTIGVKIAHCACEDLTCQAGGTCNPSTDVLYVQYSTGGGVGWANGTSGTNVPNSPPNTNYYFPLPDNYQQISDSDVEPSETLHLRYWIDPRPDAAPSGVYMANFSIRAVENSTTFGTCSCT